MRKGARLALGLGAVLTATAALAAGAYFLSGPRRPRDLRGWTLRLRGEILEEIETLDRIDRRDYEAIVDRVAARYRHRTGVDPGEWKRIVSNLKRRWTRIRRDARGEPRA